MIDEINSNGIKITQNSFQVGTRKIFLQSAEVHYFRIPPEDWEDRLTKIKALGLNTISTSINWSFHEENPEKFDIKSKDKDLDHFMHLCENKGFYIILRPGPFINADLVNGGIPQWIVKDHPKIMSLDQNNSPVEPKSKDKPPISSLSPTYLRIVEKYIQKLSEILRRHLYPHGGLILLQIDNEMSISSNFNIFQGDYNPVSIDFYKKFLKQKYKDIELVNQLYSQNFLSFEHLEPPSSKTNEDTGNLQNDFKSRGEFLRNLDWMECKEKLEEEYIASISYFLRKNGIFLPYFVNVPFTGSPIHVKEIFNAYKTKIFPGLTIDQEYLNDIENLQYELESNIEIIKTQMPLFGFISQLKIGYPDKLVPPNQVHLLLRQLLGNGIKGLNYYLGVGGITPSFSLTKISMSSLNQSLGYQDDSFILDDSGSFYDYGAPIGMIGQINPVYEVIDHFGKYIQLNSQLLLAAEVVYDHDIVILNYHPYSRLKFNQSKLGLFRKYHTINQKYRFNGYALLKKIGYNPAWMDLQQCNFEELSKYKVAMITFSSFLDEKSTNLLKKYIEEGGTLISFYDIPDSDGNMKQENTLANIYQTNIDKRENAKNIFMNGQKLTSFHLLHSLEVSDDFKNKSDRNKGIIIACNNWSNPTKIYAIQRTIQKGQFFHFGFVPSTDKTSIQLFGDVLKSLNISPRNTIFPNELTVLRLRSDNNEELVTVSNLTKYPIEKAEFTFKDVLNDDGEISIHLKGLTILNRSSSQWSINKKINKNAYVKICTSEINEIQKRTDEETTQYLVFGSYFKGSRNVLEVNLKHKPEKIFSSKKDITKRVFKPDNKLRVQFNEFRNESQPLFKIRVTFSDDVDLSVHLKGNNKTEIVSFNMKKMNTFIDQIS